MSAGPRYPLAVADRIAADVIHAIEGTYERVIVAGSIRRGRPTVGDIEIVAIPRYEVGQRDLFGDPVGEPVDMLSGRMDDLERRGQVTRRLNALGRPAWGPRLTWATWHADAGPIGLDVYTCTAEQWGVTLAIRTGDADFSRLLVTPRSQGGLCPDDLAFRGWRVAPRYAGRAVLDTPEEADVFRALGMEPVPPDRRCAAAVAVRR